MKARPAADARAGRPVTRFVLVAAAVAAVADRVVVGRDAERARRSTRTSTRVFSSTSYAPGSIATLRVITPGHNLDLQILRAGAERAWSSVGRPWGPEQHLRFRRAGVNLVRVRLGATWTSGLYFARLTTSVGKTATSRRSCFGPMSGAEAASRLCCRPTAGRHTTSSTSRATGAATRGTSTRSGSTCNSAVRSTTTASRRTTARSSAASYGSSSTTGTRRTTSATRISSGSRPATTWRSSTTWSSSRGTRST